MVLCLKIGLFFLSAFASAREPWEYPYSQVVKASVIDLPGKNPGDPPERHTLVTIIPHAHKVESRQDRVSRFAANIFRKHAYELLKSQKDGLAPRGFYPPGHTALRERAEAKPYHRHLLLWYVGESLSPAALRGSIEFTRRSMEGGDSLVYEDVLGVENNVAERLSVADHESIIRNSAGKLVRVQDRRWALVEGDDIEITRLVRHPDAEFSVPDALAIAAHWDKFSTYSADRDWYFKDIPADIARKRIPDWYLASLMERNQEFKRHFEETGNYRLSVQTNRFRIEVANHPAILRHYQSRHGFRPAMDVAYTPLEKIPAEDREVVRLLRERTAILEITHRELLDWCVEQVNSTGLGNRMARASVRTATYTWILRRLGIDPFRHNPVMSKEFKRMEREYPVRRFRSKVR